MRRSFSLRRPLQGLGVDLGSSGVKAVALASDGGGISLLGAGREALSPGVVQDGAVREPEEVGGALGRLLVRLGVRCRLVGLAIGGSSVLIKRFPAPFERNASGTASEEFRDALAREAARHVPFHLESLEFDYEDSPPLREDDRNDDEGNGSGTVVFGAAPRETIRNHCRAVSSAGREVTRIELEPYALYAAARLDAAAPASPPERAALAIVEVGASRAGVHVFGASPTLSRWARGSVVEAATASEGGPGDLLSSIPAAGTGAPVVASPPATSAASPSGADGAAIPDGRREAGRQTAGAREEGVFANRIAATLREAVREAAVRHPIRILLSGGGARLPGIRSRLAELDFGTPAVLDPLKGLGFGEQGTMYGVAAGLAFQQLLERAGTHARRRL